MAYFFFFLKKKKQAKSFIIFLFLVGHVNKKDFFAHFRDHLEVSEVLWSDLVLQQLSPNYLRQVLLCLSAKV